jgi:hypothetical protein
MDIDTHPKSPLKATRENLLPSTAEKMKRTAMIHLPIRKQAVVVTGEKIIQNQQETIGMVETNTPK